MHLRQVRALLPNENAAPQERHDLRDLATPPIDGARITYTKLFFE